MTDDKTEKCSKVLKRIKFDKRRGATTSEREKDFIRRTCRCPECLKILTPDA